MLIFILFFLKYVFLNAYDYKILHAIYISFLCASHYYYFMRSILFGSLSNGFIKPVSVVTDLN